MNRRVSVIVPTRDRPAMLRQALASIRAIEGPDVEFEILVGDNGRTEETRTLAEEFGAVYIPVEEEGAGPARTAGLRAATGQFIAFLDDDDVWLDTHLRPHLDLLQSNSALEAVIGQAIYTDPNLVRQGDPWPAEHPGEGDDLLRRMLSGFFPQIGTLVVRSHVRERVGEFDARLIGGQDLDWMMRIARLRTLGFTPTPSVLFRGRPPGSYDALQRRRIGFDRRVFLRHAVPEWRVFGSPREFIRGYHGSLRHFYHYFVGAAHERLDGGSRFGAARALTTAVINLPLLAAADLIKDTPLRRGVRGVVLGRRPDALAEAS